MVVLKCPSCGANLELDETREFAFCTYCGTKISNIQNRMRIDGIPELKSLVTRALEFEDRGDIARALEYCSRILDLDPNNQTARAIEARHPAIPSIPATNVTIVYTSNLGNAYKLRYTFDCRNWRELSPGESVSFQFPCGQHTVWFCGTKDYQYSFVVSDLHKQITIKYNALGRRNNEILTRWKTNH